MYKYVQYTHSQDQSACVWTRLCSADSFTSTVCANFPLLQINILVVTETPIDMLFFFCFFLNHCSREKKSGSLSAQLSLKIHFDAFSSFHKHFNPGKTATKKKSCVFVVVFLHHATQDGTQIKIQMLYHFMRQ